MTAHFRWRPSVGTWHLQNCKPATFSIDNKATPEAEKVSIEHMTGNFRWGPSVGTCLQSCKPVTFSIADKSWPKADQASFKHMTAHFRSCPSVGTWLQAWVGQGKKVATTNELAKHVFLEHMDQAFDDGASTEAVSTCAASTKTSTPEGDRIYPLEVLTDPRLWQNDPYINPEEREKCLSPDAFQEVFGMVKEDFGKLPKWKQDLLKKNNLLF
mmetsp:Transcript_92313/g.177953  ORF Transcript_92313/g.177953 Transcript_92313/m.177953 type:complete len:213 (-) Transcript_92313:209-847(-)